MLRRRLLRVLSVAAVTALSAMFLVEPAHAADTVVVKNTSTWKCADLPGIGPVPADTPVTQYNCVNSPADNQEWTFVYTRMLGDQYNYQIVNVKNGQCLDLPGHGSVAAATRVSTYWCNGVPDNDNQEWRLSGPRARDGQYLILNHKSGLCLDVAGWVHDGSDLANDLPLTVFPCYGAGWGNGGYDDHFWSLYP